MSEVATESGARAAAVVAGSAFGLVIGGPLGGVAGGVVGSLLTDFAQRMMSPMETNRIRALLHFGEEAVERRLSGGHRMRDDGFFEQDENVEVVEGVVIAAQREHENRKIPYIANLLGTIATDASIDRISANVLIGLAEELRWSQLVLLSMIHGRERGSMELPDVDIGRPADSTQSWAIHRELRQLQQTSLGLIGGMHSPERPGGVGRYITSVAEVRLTPTAVRLVDSMMLDTIPAEDQEQMRNGLA